MVSDLALSDVHGLHATPELDRWKAVAQQAETAAQLTLSDVPKWILESKTTTLINKKGLYIAPTDLAFVQVAQAACLPIIKPCRVESVARRGLSDPQTGRARCRALA